MTFIVNSVMGSAIHTQIAYTHLDIQFVSLLFLCNAENGFWTNWGSYGTCSTTCGQGSKSRTRTCAYNSVYHGVTCPGSNTDTTRWTQVNFKSHLS